MGYGSEYNGYVSIFIQRNKNDDGMAVDRAIIRTISNNGWTVEEYWKQYGKWDFIAMIKGKILLKKSFLSECQL